MNKFLTAICFLLVLVSRETFAKNQEKEHSLTISTADPVDMVNVFMGTSGDHGQLSPAASYPFSMLSIGPQTYPAIHTGYEYLAKKFLGFTHNRFEGVGCMGSGGNILIKPFLGEDPRASELIKASEKASPGFYEVGFENKINVQLAVLKKSGRHAYRFPQGKKGIYLDLSHAFVGRFVAEEHRVDGGAVSGWIEAQTTCSAGKYRMYYYLELEGKAKWQLQSEHELVAMLSPETRVADIVISLSSVSVEAARNSLNRGTFEELRDASRLEWNNVLSRIVVEGNQEKKELFYSLLYRTLQSPYVTSEGDGQYRNTKGELKKSAEQRYNGWAIWDNYRTQLPLLSIIMPERYEGMVSSLAELYQSGKKDFATQTEPTNTVRTEHAIVVLLDAYRKGYPVNFNKIIDSLVKEVDQLDYKHPDKALESSYDAWALSEIFHILKDKSKADLYKKKALEYKQYWVKDFQDMSRRDVDRMQARGLYQGTIWQYRWFVPFDVKGLIELEGGENAYLKRLDEFFGNDYYNHANEPDLQVPLMYNATGQSWKSQYWMHRLATDTVVQHYFNDNSRGIGAYIGQIYRNQPEAFLRTMDDDAGAMSAWYIFAASGFSPACVGWPVYYLNVPLFRSVSYRLPRGRSFKVEVENFDPQHKYIKAISLNGKALKRNYITQKDINSGGILTIVTSATPVQNQETEIWISDISYRK